MKLNRDEAQGPTDQKLAEPFAEVLERIGPLVGACNQRLGSPLSSADLDEVVQDTSLAVWRKRDTFRGEADVETWVFAVARNMILDRLRRTRNQPFVDAEFDDGDAPADPGPGPGTKADTGVARVIDDELQEAGTTVARICKARAIDGQTFGEIGERLGASEAKVKARFYRSLPRLQSRLKALWSDTAS